MPSSSKRSKGSAAQHLNGSAEEYRNQPGAMASLTDGLNRLRENAVQLARSNAREVISRFGQMGGRRLAAVG